MRICLVWLRGNYFEIIGRNIDAANIGLAIQPFLSGRLFGCITQNGAKSREKYAAFFCCFEANRELNGQNSRENFFSPSYSL
jgi:hypothetical protein